MFRLTVMVKDLIALGGIDTVFGISPSLLVLSSDLVLQTQGKSNQIKLYPRFSPKIIFTFSIALRSLDSEGHGVYAVRNHIEATNSEQTSQHLMWGIISQFHYRLQGAQISQTLIYSLVL